MNVNKDREKVLDIAKGLGIILVVLGHSIQFGSGSDYANKTLFFSNPVFIAIYSFHMTLFCSISGYLFSKSIRIHSHKKIVKEKFNRLVVPIFFWTLLYSIYLMAASIIRDGTGICMKSFIKLFVNNFFSSQWFLWAMFYFSIMVVFVNFIFKDSIFAYILIYLLLFFVKLNGNDYFVNSYISNFPAFIIAYLYGKKHAEGKVLELMESSSLVVLFNVVLYTILLLLKYIGAVNKLSYYGDRLYYIFTGLSGTVVILWMISNIYRSYINAKIWGIFEYLGSRTLGIYVIAGYIDIELLQRITRNVSASIAVNVIETIVVIVSSLAIIEIIKKIPLLNKLLLGDINA